MYAFSKRVLDLLLATTALLLLSPILVPVMIGLKLTGEGYIFYLQKRMGYKNVYFDILKFATMLKNSPNMGTGTLTLRNDPRVTPMGTFLRKTKINELPQILNVLKGDMSIVGPRPVDIKAFEAYSPEIQAKIYNSKPGITGIGSIIFRNEEDLLSASSLPPYEYYKQFISPYKGALEMWYQEHKSLWTDIVLIFLTVWVVVFPKSTIINKIFNNLPKRHF
jgi:lipopolysaccharide/colanic/teichoic acid biosynthesis glycosyltransferase